MSLDEELLDAVGDGDIARVKKLLDRGANLNAKNILGLTPLHIAAMYGNLELVDLLLKYGADANAKTDHAVTPLHLAASWGRADVVKMLLERGADVNARDDKGWTPLHFATLNNHSNVAKILLENGADANIRYNGRETLKSVESQIKALKSLNLKPTGPLYKIRDDKSRTALELARELGNEDVAEVIEEFLERRKSGEVTVRTFSKGATSPWEPVPASPSILGVDCPRLRIGEWGRLLVKIRGSGTATLSLEGDVDWLDPGTLELSGESVVEVPVRSKTSGELPVRVVVKSPNGEDAKITWLKVKDRAGKCPACGAPIEPGAKYCWKCGAKLG